MTEQYILAIDAGSGGSRAYVFDLKGKLIDLASENWEYYVPDDAPMGKEFDANIFWNIICEVIRKAIKKAKVNPKDIIAVSSASQRQGVIFLDREGRELYGGPNIDIRAIVEGFTIDGQYGQEVYDITGHKPSLLFIPARLKWFQANRPQIYEKIGTVLSMGDWILYRLCNERVGEISLVADMGAFDVNKLEWSVHLIETLQLPKNIWPTIAKSGTRLGKVTHKAVKQTGLAPETIVVVGGADTQCGLLGMGVKDEGQVGIVLGWSGCVQMTMNNPIIDSKGRIWTGCHAYPKRWILESNAQECGGGYRWVKDMLFGKGIPEQDAYTQMDDMAKNTPAGAAGTFALIGPRIMDMSDLRPNMGGLIVPITPTIMNMNRDHLVRATMENVCYAIKANLVQLENISGLKASDVCIGGGMTQSPVLVQMMADVLGKQIKVLKTPWVTAQGIAMCAAVGAGVYVSMEESIKALTPAIKTIKPDIRIAEAYSSLYDKWLKTAHWWNDLTDNLG